MKAPVWIVAASALLFIVGCNDTRDTAAAQVEFTQPTIVEAGCGRCLFGKKHDKHCNLAIRVNNAPWFVDGFTMRQFGNPDMAEGMCKKIRQAKVTGHVAKNRFVATSFDLLPAQ